MPKELNLKWSFSNSKLAKLDTVSFNIPAFESASGFKTCPKAGGCAAMCYARQGFYVMPNVAATREFNLEYCRGPKNKLVQMLMEDLSNIPNKIIRIHDSGDFFSQSYLDAWISVAKKFPKKLFYAYTKSLHLDWSALPKNFKMIQSVGGKMDKAIDPTKSHSRIFASYDDMYEAGYVDGNETDAPAIQGKIKIGLVYHGTKNLLPGQVLWLQNNEAPAYA